MPARPARKLTIRNNEMNFGEVPFNHSILTAQAFNDTIEELTSLVGELSGKVMSLSGEYAATVNDLETLSGELYATTLGASGDIWNLSAAIAELQPEEAAASNKR